MSLFILSEICNNYTEGKNICNTLLLYEYCCYIVNTEDLSTAPDLKKWLCLCCSKLFENFTQLKYKVLLKNSSSSSNNTNNNMSSNNNNNYSNNMNSNEQQQQQQQSYDIKGYYIFLIDADPCVRASVVIMFSMLFGAYQGGQNSDLSSSNLGFGNSSSQYHLESLSRSTSRNDVRGTDARGSSSDARTSVGSGGGADRDLNTRNIPHNSDPNFENIIEEEMSIVLEILNSCSDGSVMVRREAVIGLAKFMEQSYHKQCIKLIAKGLRQAVYPSSQGNGNGNIANPVPFSTMPHNSDYLKPSPHTSSSLPLHPPDVGGAGGGNLHNSTDPNPPYFNNTHPPNTNYYHIYPWNLSPSQIEGITHIVRTHLEDSGFGAFCSKPNFQPTNSTTTNDNTHSNNNNSSSNSNISDQYFGSGGPVTPTNKSFGPYAASSPYSNLGSTTNIGNLSMHILILYIYYISLICKYIYVCVYLKVIIMTPLLSSMAIPLLLCHSLPSSLNCPPPYNKGEDPITKCLPKVWPHHTRSCQVVIIYWVIVVEEGVVGILVFCSHLLQVFTAPAHIHTYIPEYTYILEYMLCIGTLYAYTPAHVLIFTPIYTLLYVIYMYICSL